jgi:hypothetical protein
MRGRERRTAAQQPFLQSGAFRKEARNYWEFVLFKSQGESTAKRFSGGDGGIRTLDTPYDV